MYSGTSKVNYWKPGTSTEDVIEKTYSVGAMLTQAEAMAMLEVQEREGTPEGYVNFGSTYNFTEIPVIKGSHVEYTYVANIDYVPAEIVVVPGDYVAKSMNIHLCLHLMENLMVRNQDVGNGLRLHSVAQLLISDNTGSIMENSAM